MDNIEEKKFPIGRFAEPAEISDQQVDDYIKTLKDFPGKLKNEVESWTDDQLDTQYREGGWKVRQLINHMADSSMNSYIRFKLALTEENPTIKPYDEQQWAELQDSFSIEIKPAIQTLKGVHKRWVYELKSLTNKELESTFFHPGQNKSISLRENLAFCAWHCDHHLAHIQHLKKEKNW
ncbi:putative metal-dependent hydrolase [Kaistella daneshvariae]|uniref:Metal-dependent hydrolase n=1 Tax=Kaistella daneshvariae TaxID=2487074 RepID=A0A3N0WZN4_9FLAO|nr:putative metal-dependent hydrolase [Kaistella daneshvariae]AZI67967.1 putative metal-dependent hydrolase [Kaistella daneshvariae]ROI10604.1 putative metal-dependent hydrolase [Kaistella daneshvariae]